jgi:hypothetical protein
MELPRQYTTSKGKPNFIGLTLFLLSITALSYQIYVNRLNIKRHEEEESGEVGTQKSTDNKISSLESRISALESKL